MVCKFHRPAGAATRHPALGEPHPPRWVSPPLNRAGNSELLERLAARGDAELAEQALHVRADGVLGDEEPLRDLVGAEVLVEQEQHLELAGRERCRDRVGHARAAAVPVRTWSSSRRATEPESAASPWATPSRNSAIRSGGSLFSR